MTLRITLIAILGAGCTVNADDSNTSFADPNSMGAATTPAMTSVGDGMTSSPVTTGPTSDAGTGEASTSSPTSPSSGGGDNGMQPANGQYSDCLMVNECVGLNVCVLSPDSMDGFCSTTNCTDASACDASPGGDAVPACVTYLAGMACALDCSGGASCPGGMVCLMGTPSGDVCF